MALPRPLSRLVEFRLPGRLSRLPPEVVGVVLLALTLVGLGIGRRDLAGDELHMLRGGMLEIFTLSLDPAQPFTGHLPWSFWLRELVLSILPDQNPLAWRLHSMVAMAACAGSLCWLSRASLGRGWALLMGVLLAAHPLLIFHGQDASNYAWSALSGVVLLGALHGSEDGHRLERKRWLIGALCLGAINDYWFALPAIVSLLKGLASCWRADDRGRRLRDLGRVWAIPLVLGAAIGISLLSRDGSGEVLGSHADLGKDTGSPAWRILNRICGTALDGLGAGRSDQLWESLPPVVLTALALGIVCWKGSALARRAAHLVLGSLVLAVGLGIGLQASTGRALPMEPRSFLVLLPLLLLVWLEAIRLQRGIRSRVLAGVFAVLVLAPSWRQLGSTSELHSWAASEVSRQVQEGDLVVASEPLSWRLELPEGVSQRPCLPPGPPPADRLWWIRLQDGSQPLSLQPCPDDGQELVDLAEFEARFVDARGPPEHERNSASFLTPVVLTRYEKGPTSAGTDVVRELQLESGLFSGLDGGRLRLSLETEAGTVLLDEKVPESTQRLEISMEADPLALRVELLPVEPEGLPHWSLFDPYWRTIHGWEPIPLSASQPTGTWQLEAPALGAPGWQVTRRLLRCALVLTLLLPLLSGLQLRPGSVTEPSRRRVRGTRAAMGLAVLSMVGWRLSRLPLDAFGDSAAQYIEHLARLQALDRIVRADAVWSPLGLLQAGDGMYPPLLHLLTLGMGRLVGYGAEPAVWTGLLWLGLLALAMGRLAQFLDPGPGRGTAVGLAILLTPALHGVTTRYSYDLPMTALLWAGLACVAASTTRQGRAAWVRAGLGGLLLASAALVKWTALPFGAIMLLGLGVGMARERGRRVALERIGICLALVALPVLAFLASGSTSLGAMGAATFQPPVGTALESYPWLQSMVAVLPDALGDRVGAMILQLMELNGERLGFYPGRLITTVFSPLLTIPLAVGLWTWARGKRRGLELVGITVLGHWLFCLLLVPPLDDRFLLTLTPGLAMAGTLGWLRLGGPILRVASPAVLVSALWVAGDFHLRAPATSLHTDPSTSLAATENGGEWTGRVGLSSSIHLRGWVRSDEIRPDRTALREALWSTVRRCQAPVAAGPSSVLTAWGDSNWWAWRDLLERAELGLKTHPDPVVRYLELSATSPGRGEGAQLLLTPEPLDAFGAPSIVPDHRVWESLGHLQDPDGGPGVRVWQLRGGEVCPTDIAQ